MEWENEKRACLRSYCRSLEEPARNTEIVKRFRDICNSRGKLLEKDPWVGEVVVMTWWWKSKTK